MKKRAGAIGLILFLTSLFFAANAYAVRSNLCRTKVGEPSEQKEIGCEESSPVDTGDGTAPPPGTVPPAPSDVRQALIDEFGITMNGFDNNHLVWAWEKLWESTNTKFRDLVRGSVIEGIPVSPYYYSEQKGCPGGDSPDVLLKTYPDRDFFKFIFTHELGHVVRNCNDRSVIQWNEHVNAYTADGGGISYYGNNAAACTGSENLSEDYADMIAYYVNPAAGLATPACAPDHSPPNPFFDTPSAFPAHLTVVKTVLDK